MSEENWKDVVGYEGLYRVSDFGRVYSVRRKSKQNHWVGGRLMHPQLAPHGYAIVTLSRSGGQKSISLHRMVLDAFVGPRPIGKECCHWDSKRTNNRLENLRWDSRQANAKDKERHGTASRGTSNPAAKLCELDVCMIRDLDAKQVDIAEFFDISQEHVSDIRTRKAWRHLKDQAA